MNYGSVCSGIETATQAWQPLGWRSVFFSEIEQFPSAVLAHHYGSNMPDEPLSQNGTPNYGDMTRYKEWRNHDQNSDRPIDVLVGGTPCQSYSVAGLRKGLADPRGDLMLTYGAIAKRFQPRWCVWENVPGVLSSNKGRDFGTFLRLLGECGYGFAYRVLDTQYIRVDGFPEAIPQRRRRVFVVGYLGDWRRAAAVLFEQESLLGYPAPRRKKKEGNAARVGTGFNAGSHAQYVEGEHSRTLRSAGGDLGGGSETILTEASQPIAARMVAFGEYTDDGTASTLKHRDYKDATDLVAFNSRQNPEVYGDKAGPLDASSPQAQAIAIAGNTIDRKAENGGNGKGFSDEVSYTLTKVDRHAVAFAQNSRDEVRKIGGDGGVTGALTAEPRAKQQTYVASCPVADTLTVGANQTWGRPGGEPIAKTNVHAIDLNWSVRRLTPIECERLQGFPDDYTRIAWRKHSIEDCPDGHRYKALGNAMSVNVMRWIGERIDLVDKL